MTPWTFVSSHTTLQRIRPVLPLTVIPCFSPPHHRHRLRQPPALLHVSSHCLGAHEELCVVPFHYPLSLDSLFSSRPLAHLPLFLPFLFVPGGTPAFLSHCKKVAQLYETRRIWFEELAHKHLDGIATWVSSPARPFFFFRLPPPPLPPLSPLAYHLRSRVNRSPP